MATEKQIEILKAATDLDELGQILDVGFLKLRIKGLQRLKDKVRKRSAVVLNRACNYGYG